MAEVVLCDTLKLLPSENHTKAHVRALPLGRLFSCFRIGRSKPQRIMIRGALFYAFIFNIIKGIKSIAYISSFLHVLNWYINQT